jgi:hypothetical protein
MSDKFLPTIPCPNEENTSKCECPLPYQTTVLGIRRNKPIYICSLPCGYNGSPDTNSKCVCPANKKQLQQRQPNGAINYYCK